MSDLGENPLIFNGKKYISSRRASQITGYTTDYIGQLARSGKIQSRMVGRNRFVDELAILEYLNSDKSHAPVKRKPNVQKQDSSTASGVDSGREINHSVSSPASVLESEQRVEGGDKYSDVDDSQGLGDEFKLDNEVGEKKTLQKKVKDNVSTPFAFASALVVVILVGVFLNFGPGRDGLSLFVKSFDGDILVATESQEAFVSATEVKDTLDKVDSVFLGYLDSVDRKIALFTISLRDKILSWFEDDTQLVTTPVNDGEKGNTNTDSETNNQNVEVEIDEDKLRRYVREIMLAEQDVFAPGGPYGGIVTLPSSGDPSQDAALLQRIQASFSDEVVVRFSDKNTGYIQPVFRDPSNSDPYLFMMLPVQQGQ